MLLWFSLRLYEFMIYQWVNYISSLLISKMIYNCYNKGNSTKWAGVCKGRIEMEKWKKRKRENWNLQIKVNAQQISCLTRIQTAILLSNSSKIFKKNHVHIFLPSKWLIDTSLPKTWMLKILFNVNVN